jgi:hypothetical protein
MPRDPIVFEEGEELVSISEKALLIGQDIFRSIGLMQNHLAIKMVNRLPKLLEMPLL